MSLLYIAIIAIPPKKRKQWKLGNMTKIDVKWCKYHQSDQSITSWEHLFYLSGAYYKTRSADVPRLQAPRCSAGALPGNARIAASGGRLRGSWNNCLVHRTCPLPWPGPRESRGFSESFQDWSVKNRLTAGRTSFSSSEMLGGSWWSAHTRNPGDGNLVTTWHI